MPSLVRNSGREPLFSDSRTVQRFSNTARGSRQIAERRFHQQVATVELEDTAVEHGFRVRVQGLGEYRKKSRRPASSRKIDLRSLARQVRE
jgi:hypothetical protein